MAASSSARPLNLDENAFGEMLYKRERIGSSASPKLYDVFINHRGPDVKNTLALELYDSLEKVGIRAFLDCKEMELGDLFPSTIQNAICSASVQIAIFSKRYAESVWCLAELALMLQTKRKIIPIFYDVPPSDLRYWEKGVYAHSFNNYRKNRRHLDKLDDWKEVLRRVSFINGYEFNHNNEDLETPCKDVVSAVRRELERRRPLEAARYPTGIQELVEDFERRCWQQEEKGKVIGIYGMGGSGKTTLAKELFNQKRSEFSASCFLFDVRESKLTSLQTKLLKDLVQENRMFNSIDDGSRHLRSRLTDDPDVNFLIVMDDIDHLDQLDALLVRDLLVNKSGSLIIVTTRDEGVLKRAEINSRYKMKEMNVHHSTELFCWHAFHQPYPTSGYEDLVESFVKECGGLPLSLKVLGGHVFGSADKHYWRLELEKVRKTLKLDIKKKLRISLESLDNEQIQVFLDIACFFVNKSRHMALRIMEGSGWSAEHTLQILMDKCLVEVQVGRSYWNRFESESIPLLRMHDNIRDLGREIADYELSSPSRRWRSQHLRSQEEKGFESILAGMSGHSFRCLNSIFDQYTRLQFRYFLGNVNDCDGPSTSLLWLEIDSSMLEKLDEHENTEGAFMSSVSSSHTIPSWIPLQSLQVLKISQGHFQRLWRSDHQVPLQLKDLILDGTNLEEFPNSLGMLSYLENLVLAGRVKWNGREWNNSMRIQGRFLSESLTKLANLKSLELRDFTISGELSFKNRMDSTTIETSMVRLEKIDIRDVKHISKVSISGEHLASLKFLHLECIEGLTEVDLGLDARLNIEGCSEIEELPSSACPCCLETITIDGCWKLQKINGIEELQGLKYLHLSAGTGAIFGCIEMWQRLPSQVISLVWESNTDAEGFQKKFSVLSSIIGLDGNVTEIPTNPKAEFVVPMTEQPSAIIILMLIESLHKGKDCRKSLKIPPVDTMVASIGEGEYIAAVVVTDEEKIIKMQHGMSSWIPTVSNGRVIKGFIVTIQQSGKLKTLPLLQYLCSHSQEVIGVQDNFRFRYISENLKVEFSSQVKLCGLENLVREVMIHLDSPLTGPPRILLQSLKNLVISGGSFIRLWPRHGRGAFQLKELVLDGIRLKEFPNSFEMLGHLENLAIAGREWGSSIIINGRSFSESLGKLTNLRSLELRNLTLRGELSFQDSMLSTTLGTPMVGLEKIDIRNVENISKVSISCQYFCSLRSLRLEDLSSLNEVVLGKCPKSKREGCSGQQCCSKTIIVYGCWMLHKFECTEELKGYLHYEAGFGEMWWQQLPSRVSCIIWGNNIWNLSRGMKKKLEASITSSVDLFNGLDVRVSKIPDGPEEELGNPVTEETSAVVIFVIVNGGRQMDWIEFLGDPPRKIASGGFEHVPVLVAVVVREKEKMNEMLHWIRLVVRSGVYVVSMVTFGNREKIRGEPLDFVNQCCKRVPWRTSRLWVSENPWRTYVENL